MNSIRRLMVVGALTIGALELGVPTTFAAGSYASYAPDDSRTSWALEKAGKTVYYTNNRNYHIYDLKQDPLAVGVRFYRSDGHYTHVDFKPCNEGTVGSCPGHLPREVTGPICMMTGVGNGTDPNKYEYGQPVCFHVGP